MKFFDRVRVNTPTTGTGDISLSTPVSSLFTTAYDAGARDNDPVAYIIQQGADYEIGEGIIGNGATTLTRTVRQSKIANVVGINKVELSGTATIELIASAKDFQTLYDSASVWNRQREVTINDSFTLGLGDTGTIFAATATDAIVCGLPPLVNTVDQVFMVKNAGANPVTLEPYEDELIENLANVAVPPGALAIIHPAADKSRWRCEMLAQAGALVTLNTAFQKPTGLPAKDDGDPNRLATMGDIYSVTGADPDETIGLTIAYAGGN